MKINDQDINFISVIVCTYNRADILKMCLQSLFTQTALPKCFEVIVVDNSSTDNTKGVIENFQRTEGNLRYVLETKQGLSHARNCGYKNALGQWVAYMDDDGLPAPDYIKKSLDIINDFDFDCFGGRYTAWYRNPKPKWLSDDFGSSIILKEKTSILENDYNSGGIIFFKKQVLEDVGGFSSRLGMSGKKIAYGEETEVQKKMRDKGFKIGYSPDVVMEHLVSDAKLRLNWHLKRYYAHGRDNVEIYQSSVKEMTIWSFLKVTFYKLKKKFPEAFQKLLFDKKYFLQNFILDSLQPVYYLYGYYKAAKKK